MLVPPSPKSHSLERGVPVVFAMNWTVSGAEPDVGVPVKETDGNVGTGVGVDTSAGVASVTGAALTLI